MPNPKKKIGLIAVSVRFTMFSIVYNVKFSGLLKSLSGIVISDNSIADKDLIIKPTYIDAENMEVIFTPSNVTPHFYQAILDKKIKSINEFKVEQNNIYSVGDVVGYILV